ncbi:class I tRNA ligase family protein, partial [archaeon]|nr:class I tRNA ligase family protein [archaeon]
STKNAKSYNMHKNAVDLQEFIINDFSRWYIKLIRDRVWPAYDKKDKNAAFYTLHEVTKTLSLLMSPITPLIAEHVHQNVLRDLGDKSESVHLCAWPKPDKKLIDKKMESEMELVKEISETVNSMRKDHNLKQRWPIEKVIIESKDAVIVKTIKKFYGVLSFVTNAKKIEFGAGEQGFVEKEFTKGKVYVSKTVLKDEALLRELLREIQSERKKRKLIVNNKIILFLDNNVMEKFSNEIKEKVGAKEIKFCHLDEGFGSVKMDDAVVKFKFSLVKQ